MDSEKCRAYLCALEAGSLSAAAERLDYTPSGVSRMMESLEKELGLPLLIRGRNGVEPTEQAQQLLPLLREMADCAERCRQRAAQIRGRTEGTVTIDSSYPAYYPWLARCMADFRREHPGVQVRLVMNNSTELCRAVAERRMDLCFVSRREGEFDWYPLRLDAMVAWVSCDSQWAKEPGFPVEAFAREPYIEMHPGRDTDNRRLLAECGVTPNVCYQSDDNHAAYSMVEAGLGVVLNNELIARSWSGGVKILPLIPPQSVEIGVAAPAADRISPVAAAFLTFLKERFREAEPWKDA